MLQDYSVYPSTIKAESGVIWSYDNASLVSIFDDNHPLHVSTNKCHFTSICLWYISPLHSLNDSLGTEYALLGEWNKWTAVSQQRFKSIVTDTQNHQATITIEGVSSEIISVVIFHSKLFSITVNCQISSASGQARIVITPINVSCI